MRLPDPSIELYVEIEPSRFMLVATAGTLEQAKDYLKKHHYVDKRWYAVGKNTIASSK